MKPEALNKKAIQIINRVRDKLTGKWSTFHMLSLNSGSESKAFGPTFNPSGKTNGESFIFLLAACHGGEACEQSLQLFLSLGRDFSHDETLDVPTQVELLIKQATSHENLCQCYIGW